MEHLLATFFHFRLQLKLVLQLPLRRQQEVPPSPTRALVKLPVSIKFSQAVITLLYQPNNNQVCTCVISPDKGSRFNSLGTILKKCFFSGVESFRAHFRPGP